MTRTVVFLLVMVCPVFAIAQPPATVLQEALQRMEQVIKEENENLAFW